MLSCEPYELDFRCWELPLFLQDSGSLRFSVITLSNLGNRIASGVNGDFCGSSSAPVTLKTGERTLTRAGFCDIESGAGFAFANAVRSVELFLAAKKPRCPTDATEEPRL